MVTITTTALTTCPTSAHERTYTLLGPKSGLMTGLSHWQLAEIGTEQGMNIDRENTRKPRRKSNQKTRRKANQKTRRKVSRKVSRKAGRREEKKTGRREGRNVGRWK